MSSVISAISTPVGRGGVAMIRVSGKGAIEMCDKIFKGKKPLCEVEANKAVYGNIVLNGEVIDDGVFTVFRGPRSFTGEDTVEICCHGGILITQKVLSATYSAGARPAEAGEFTRRAFSSGRLSLSEAEAVIDLIDAESNEQLKLARSHADGVMTRAIESIREELVSLISQIYVFVDYPDEDLSDVTPEEATERTRMLLTKVQKLCRSYGTGKVIREGIDTVICGKPNTGKSSLLNALSGYDRAIVTSVPGTTRDTVEERINLGRLTLNLCDTAGIHATEDEVERLGIERSIRKIEDAQLTLAVFDGSKALDGEDKEVIAKLDPVTSIIIINKGDLGCVLSESDFEGFENIVYISAKNNEGTEKLTEIVEAMFMSNAIDYSKDAIISNARQFACAETARASLENALDALTAGYTPDVGAMELELALGALSELDSRKVSEEVVNAIFSRFCIGK
ncbi:MAG: tRNA uridine-5-carboxymethylaminomethyl(34) synthesis GTPase MnmE [Clostridia bacterium]|nr:tRNA uridine-5-carboxymethylaminomethyl(34) synthesis GTPase MnmE [Clostridia bacterium]